MAMAGLIEGFIDQRISREKLCRNGLHETDDKARSKNPRTMRTLQVFADDGGLRSIRSLIRSSFSGLSARLLSRQSIITESHSMLVLTTTFARLSVVIAITIIRHSDILEWGGIQRTTVTVFRDEGKICAIKLQCQKYCVLSRKRNDRPLDCVHV